MNNNTKKEFFKMFWINFYFIGKIFYHYIDLGTDIYVIFEVSDI